MANRLDQQYTNDGQAPVTGDALLGLGFQRLANGQFELPKENHIFLCYRHENHDWVLKRLTRSHNFSSASGYFQMTIDRNIRHLRTLAVYIPSLHQPKGEHDEK